MWLDDFLEVFLQEAEPEDEQVTVLQHEPLAPPHRHVQQLKGELWAGHTDILAYWPRPPAH